MKRFLILLLLFFFYTNVTAETFTDSQRKTGEIILKGLSVNGRCLSFTADTGGCTKKNSFRLNIKKVSVSKEKINHYQITVERIIPDNCKGLFPEGIVIEFDLEKDCGLKGVFTVSISNKIIP
ncbi:MAG TPA: hypothetical protein PK906_13315 [Spirochaetota bacterium]|nr:hypothetical protein [Spirochaetota bacterium]